MLQRSRVKRRAPKPFGDRVYFRWREPCLRQADGQRQPCITACVFVLVQVVVVIVGREQGLFGGEEADEPFLTAELTEIDGQDFAPR